MAVLNTLHVPGMAVWRARYASIAAP
ncbi:hypothetical protein AvCA_48320 [Azotobacter vinelandii CA]|uniref:Uncharacterized protein n=2 Tax=Azotobacter vinelandii TaxID=354 RepID=C1DK30_AZOVD|nr:hypothetical protein Avin_48320 [Azotobacter vinelandii DJ]AGK14229.1 hypothetical protein AvCA_48320 [Azotobacter vinelandii CA]AGK22244.1 hypothetical protein AvCA6_48320 [Azotobacter vinelandii CA6]